MSCSKLKRTSFHIDDILSLKTGVASNSDSSQDVASDSSSQDTSDRNQRHGTRRVSRSPRHTPTEASGSRTASPSMHVENSAGFFFSKANDAQSRLFGTGEQSESMDIDTDRIPNSAHLLNGLFLNNFNTSTESGRTSTAFTLTHNWNIHSNLLTELEKRRREQNPHSEPESNNNDSIIRPFPLNPRHARLPWSLESLVSRTHAREYLLSHLAPPYWAAGALSGLATMDSMATPLEGLATPALDLSVGRKTCLCGSPRCDLHRTEESKGGNLLRPSLSPTSGCMALESVPLPVYMRTRCEGAQSAKPKKCRRSRTVFTELQLLGLEKRFESQKYLSTPDRLDVAERLGLSQLQVKTWYQNRRMKWKKQVLQGGGTEAPTKPKGRPRKDSLHGDSPSGQDCGSTAHASDSCCSDPDEDAELSDI